MKFREIVNVAHVVKEENDRTSDVQASEDVDFVSLMLSQSVLAGLKKSGFKKPSPVQLSAIPVGKLGVDLIVQAKSGTGKTCVFAVMALEAVTPSNREPQVLILAPTREIAQQIFENTRSIGSVLIQKNQLSLGLFIGGTNLRLDLKALDKGCQIVIGTPGRVCQLVQKGRLDLAGVKLFVLDEADKLMEYSYQESVNWLFSQLPRSKQVGVFSATYPEELDNFLSNYMETPTMVRLDAADVQLLGIKQFLCLIDDKKSVTNSVDYLLESDEERWNRMWELKLELLHNLLKTIKFTQCLAFCNYQDKAELVCNRLKELGIKADFISSQLDQEQRSDVIKRLKRFQCRLLISTDLTARGIDAQNVDFVVNLETPSDPETYFHRIGRAGRFGGYGAAVTLAVNGIDDRRFFAVGSDGEFNTKMMPRIDSDRIPSDLCSNQGFWESCPPVPFPAKKPKLESTNGMLPGSTRSGAASQSWRSMIRDENPSTSRGPFREREDRKKGKGPRNRDPNRLDPEEFEARFGSDLEFEESSVDYVELESRSYDRESLINLNSQNLGILPRRKKLEVPDSVELGKELASNGVFDPIAALVSNETSAFCRSRSPILPPFEAVKDEKKSSERKGHNVGEMSKSGEVSGILGRLASSKKSSVVADAPYSRPQVFSEVGTESSFEEEKLPQLKREEATDDEEPGCSVNVIPSENQAIEDFSDFDSLPSEAGEGKAAECKFSPMTSEELLSRWESKAPSTNVSMENASTRPALSQLQFPWEKTSKTEVKGKESLNAEKGTVNGENILDRYYGISSSSSGGFTGFKDSTSKPKSRENRQKSKIDNGARNSEPIPPDPEDNSLRSWDSGELLNDYLGGTSLRNAPIMPDFSKSSGTIVKLPETVQKAQNKAKVSKAYADLFGPESSDQKQIVLSTKPKAGVQSKTKDGGPLSQRPDVVIPSPRQIPDSRQNDTVEAAYAVLKDTLSHGQKGDAQIAYAKLLDEEVCSSPTPSSVSSNRRGKRPTVSDRFRHPPSPIIVPTSKLNGPLASVKEPKETGGENVVKSAASPVSLAALIASTPPVRVPNSKDLDSASLRKVKELEAKLLGFEVQDSKVVETPKPDVPQIAEKAAPDTGGFDFNQFLEKYQLKSVAPCAPPFSADNPLFDGDSLVPPRCRALMKNAEAVLGTASSQNSQRFQSLLKSPVPNEGSEGKILSENVTRIFEASDTSEPGPSNARAANPADTRAQIISSPRRGNGDEESRRPDDDDGTLRYDREALLDICRQMLGKRKYTREQCLEVFDSKTDKIWKVMAKTRHGYHTDLRDDLSREVFCFDSRRRGPMNRRPQISSITSLAKSVFGGFGSAQSAPSTPPRGYTQEEEEEAKQFMEEERKKSGHPMINRPVLTLQPNTSVQSSPSSRTKFYEYLNRTADEEVSNAVSGRKAEFPLHYDDPVPPAPVSERPIAKARPAKKEKEDKLFFQKKSFTKPLVKDPILKSVELPILASTSEEEFKSRSALPSYDDLCAEYRRFVQAKANKQVSTDPDPKVTESKIRRGGVIGPRLTTEEVERFEEETNYILDTIEWDIARDMMTEEELVEEEEEALYYQHFYELPESAYLPYQEGRVPEELAPEYQEDPDRTLTFDEAQCLLESKISEVVEGRNHMVTITAEENAMDPDNWDNAEESPTDAENRNHTFSRSDATGMETGSGDQENCRNRRSSKECETAYLQSISRYHEILDKWEQALVETQQHQSFAVQNAYIQSMIQGGSQGL